VSAQTGPEEEAGLNFAGIAYERFSFQSLALWLDHIFTPSGTGLLDRRNPIGLAFFTHFNTRRRSPFVNLDGSASVRISPELADSSSACPRALSCPV
jgi:hypothetical protein